MENNMISIAEEHIQQGQVLYSEGNFDKALEYFKKAESEDAMNPAVYLNEGQTYVMLDKYDEAKEAFLKVLLIDKDNAEVYFHLGNIEFLLDNFENGREYYAKAVNNGFDQPELYFNLATVFEDMGNDNEAIKYYNKVIAKDKFRADAKFRKAEIYISQKDNIRAIQALDSLIETNPDVFEGHHYKALLLMQMEDYSGAEAVLNKAMAMFPEDKAFAFDKVLLLEKKGEYDEALKYIDREFDDVMTPDLAKEKAKILMAQGNYEEGVKLFEKVRGEETEDFDEEVRYFLINIYIMTERYTEAMECCDEIIAQKAETAYYYAAIYFKAECLQRQGKESEASAAFRDATEIFRRASSNNPGLMDLYIYRALGYKTLKQYDKAFEMVEYMLAVNDDFAEAYLIRAELNSEMGLSDKAEADKAAAAARNKMFGMLIQ